MYIVIILVVKEINEIEFSSWFMENCWNKIILDYIIMDFEEKRCYIIYWINLLLKYSKFLS